MFRVILDNGHETLGYTAGKMRRYRIRIFPGDRIKLELFYLITNGVELAGVVDLPRSFESVVNGRTVARVAVARLAVARPSAIVLCEPTVNRPQRVQVLDQG